MYYVDMNFDIFSPPLIQAVEWRFMLVLFFFKKHQSHVPIVVIPSGFSHHNHPPPSLTTALQ